MRIFAIETSCDETAAAIVEDGRIVRSSVIATSKEMFERSGGVIPEEAARKQLECITSVIKEAMHTAHNGWAEITGIAVTRGPGLLGSLIVGTTAGRTLASLYNLPLIGVHHTLGHLSSTWLDQSEEIRFPILTLSASGGHTELWHRTSHTEGKLLGRTRDDAAGEAFDKGALLLGLPYPGGPAIAKEATKGNPRAFPFPLPLQKEHTLDFSFSGLKTALRYTLRDTSDWQERIPDLAASYEAAICTHMVDRIVRALEQCPEAREIHLVGGVSANLMLRTMMQAAVILPLRFPTKMSYCTDNAAMIAAAGYFLLKERGDDAVIPFETVASLPLEAALSSLAGSS